MFWGDKIIQQIEKDYAADIKSGDPLIIRDEKTMSGRVHVGSLRGVAIHGIVSELLNDKGINNEYLFEVNDFDPMDGMPKELDEAEYGQYMGFPLKNVPSPDPKFENFAELVADEFIQVVEATGFKPTIYRLYPEYKAGRFDETIRLALENADKIREIYKKISGSEKPDDWYPLNVVCESCGKIGTTKVTGFDGEQVTYHCLPGLVTWAKGCKYQGKISPFGGNAKLPWKVEWAAKFKVFNVKIEGAGKDHATKGGSRDIAKAICYQVFNYQPPLDIPYNFIVLGGKKMSSSKGLGSTAKDMSDLLPPEILRMLMIKTKPQHEIDFDPTGDTIPVLYDYHDEAANEYFQRVEDSDKARIFALSYPEKDRANLTEHFYPRFSNIAYLSQMPHIDLEVEAEKMKGSTLTKLDKDEVRYRATYAKYWLDKYSPEKFRITLHENSVPEEAKSLNNIQKQALQALVDYLQTEDQLDGQKLHTKLHDIKKEQDIEPKELFEAIYKSLLGSASGPKAGWFLSVLDKDFLVKRFTEVSK